MPRKTRTEADMVAINANLHRQRWAQDFNAQLLRFNITVAQRVAYFFGPNDITDDTRDNLAKFLAGEVAQLQHLADKLWPGKGDGMSRTKRRFTPQQEALFNVIGEALTRVDTTTGMDTANRARVQGALESLEELADSVSGMHDYLEAMGESLLEP